MFLLSCKTAHLLQLPANAPQFVQSQEFDGDGQQHLPFETSWYGLVDPQIEDLLSMDSDTHFQDIFELKGAQDGFLE